MRRFSLRSSLFPGVPAHIVAELADGEDEAGAGPAVQLLTQLELEAMGTEAEAALTAWLRYDDSAASRHREELSKAADAEDERWVAMSGQAPRYNRVVIPLRPDSSAMPNAVAARAAEDFDDDGWLCGLRRWDQFLAAAGRSKATRDGYRYFALRFFADVLLPPDEITEDVITEYLADLAAKSQRQQLLRTLKSYFGWAMRRKLVRTDPAAGIPYSPPKYAPTEALTEDELHRVVIAAAWRNPRRAWLILLLLETGARLGSVAALDIADCGTEPGQVIHFRVTKGDRPYSVPLSPVAATAVRELIALAKPGQTALLARHRNSLSMWYHDAAVAADLPKRKQRAHILRATFATNLLTSGVDVRTVQTLLNHADLSQMHRYTAVSDGRSRQAVAPSVSTMFASNG